MLQFGFKNGLWLPPNLPELLAYYKGKTNDYGDQIPVGVSRDAAQQVKGSALQADGNGYTDLNIPAAQLVDGLTIELDYWHEGASDGDLRIIGGEDGSSCLRTFGSDYFGYATSSSGTGGYFIVNTNLLSTTAVNRLRFEITNDGVNTNAKAYLNGELRTDITKAQESFALDSLYLFKFNTTIQPDGRTANVKVWDKDDNLICHLPMINVAQDYEYDASGRDNHATHTGYTGDAVQEITDGTGTNYANEFGYNEDAAGKPGRSPAPLKNLRTGAPNTLGAGFSYDSDTDTLTKTGDNLDGVLYSLGIADGNTYRVKFGFSGNTGTVGVSYLSGDRSGTKSSADSSGTIDCTVVSNGSHVSIYASKACVFQPISVTQLSPAIFDVPEIQPKPILDAVNKPCVVGDGSLQILIPDALTTDTIVAVDGSGVPTSTTNGEYDIASDTKVWAFDLERSGETWAQVRCENGHPNIYPGVEYVQDILNDELCSITGATGEAYGTRDEGELVSAQRAYDVDLEGPNLWDDTDIAQQDEGWTYIGDGVWESDGTTGYVRVGGEIGTLTQIKTVFEIIEYTSGTVSVYDGAGNNKQDESGVGTYSDIFDIASNSKYMKSEAFVGKVKVHQFSGFHQGITIADENGNNIYGNRAEFQPNTKAHADSLPCKHNFPAGPEFRTFISDTGIVEPVSLVSLPNNVDGLLIKGNHAMLCYEESQSFDALEKFVFHWPVVSTTTETITVNGEDLFDGETALTTKIREIA